MMVPGSLKCNVMEYFFIPKFILKKKHHRISIIVLNIQKS